MIRIAVCDDNLDLANSVENKINHITEEEFYCDVFQSGTELITYLKSNQSSYNIYLMDIEMPGQNGIETAYMIRQRDKDALIIFMTDYKEYVYEVFEVLPFRFLRKPISESELSKVLSDAAEQIRLSGQVFFFQIGREKYQLHYHEIIYFEGSGRKVIIHSQEATYEIYAKIADIYADIDSKLFCQIHASYIANMDYILSIKKTDMILRDGKPLQMECFDTTRHSAVQFFIFGLLPIKTPAKNFIQCHSICDFMLLFDNRRYHCHTAAKQKYLGICHIPTPNILDYIRIDPQDWNVQRNVDSLFIVAVIPRNYSVEHVCFNRHIQLCTEFRDILARAAHSRFIGIILYQYFLIYILGQIFFSSE